MRTEMVLEAGCGANHRHEKNERTTDDASGCGAGGVIHCKGCLVEILRFKTVDNDDLTLSWQHLIVTKCPQH